MNQVQKLGSLENLGYFAKGSLYALFKSRPKALAENLSRWACQGKIIRLKKGMYVTKVYVDRVTQRSRYLEYLANSLRFPSYLSLEYVLELHGVLSESVFAYTSVTTKVGRYYKNAMGLFTYRHMHERLFCDFEWVENGPYQIRVASKPKALFDYLYLKFFRSQFIAQDLVRSLRLTVDQFSKREKNRFEGFCAMTGVQKFMQLPKLVFGK